MHTVETELQFERTETTGSTQCGSCAATLQTSYFEANGTLLCQTCAEGVRQMLNGTGLGIGRFGKAILFGVGAAILGAALYYGVLALTGYEVGLVSIVVGFLVGRAVRAGSGGRGGLKYQLLAVALTYIAIVSTYVPLLINEFKNSPPAAENSEAGEVVGETQATSATVDSIPADADAQPIGVGRFILGWAIIFAFAMALPFLAGLQNIIGLLIIGFGLWEAWRVNKRLQLEISGPYPIAGM